MRRILLTLAALLLASAAAAQLPRTLPNGKAPAFTQSLRQWVKTAHMPRRVTVAEDGSGDYTTITAALAYVATQVRSETERWIVELYPGEGELPDFGYTAATLTVPSFTLLRGADSVYRGGATWGYQPGITLTATTGTLITLGDGAGLQNLFLYYAATRTGAVSIIKNTSDAFSFLIDDVGIMVFGGNEAALDFVTVANDAGAYLYACYMTQIGDASSTRFVVNTGTTGFTVWGGRYAPGTSQLALIENTTAATVRVFYARFDAGSSADLKNSGAGALQVEWTSYWTSSGTITHEDDSTLLIPGTVRFERKTTLPATCTQDAMTWVSSSGGSCSTAPCWCVCTATDTWKCSALS